MQNKEIKNFLSKNIHDDTLDSILLISARVNDDADYEMITQAAVVNAITPFTTWLNESGMQHIVEMNWGHSWLDKDAYSFPGQMYINVVAKPTVKSPPWQKEDMMMFKLKFSDMLPLTDINEYISEILSQN